MLHLLIQAIKYVICRICPNDANSYRTAYFQTEILHYLLGQHLGKMYCKVNLFVLLNHMLKKYYTQTDDQEDLISIGTIGLIKAVNTFRADKGIRLATYASRCIENEILMYFRSMRKSAQDVSLSDCIETGADGTPLELMEVVGSDTDLFDRISARESIREVRDAVQSSLTEQERRVITLRYGLDGKPPMKQREAAAAAGISRSYVSRIEKRALEKLRRTLASGGSTRQVATWD